jgi:formate dehydrogenase iron-sulfur subunit
MSHGYGDAAQPRMGFFTDTTVCIGCKACEVACKEWNDVPADIGGLTGDSYDNTGTLDANTWRHVAFIEQPVGTPATEFDITQLAVGFDGAVPQAQDGFRWLMSSDVCKHCTTAGCLDVCPTGAIFKTEFETVVIQSDVCNGCGYCVVGCPYGVITRRETDGRAFKCTLCYDRLQVGEQPACAKACPTDSINFGTYDAMQALSRDRLDQVVAAGVAGAHLYGEPDGDGRGVDGAGSVFLLLDEPEVYGLPPDPVAPTKHASSVWRAAGVAAALFVGLLGAAFGPRR